MLWCASSGTDATDALQLPVTFTFIPIDQHGHEPFIEVNRGGLVRGHIRKSTTTGLYRYFPEVVNLLDPVLEHADLEALKEAVTQSLQSRH